eukprot:TRINITY_DN44123_c0_g1_i1.p1 TRINITY_DN44123_c0_g1~~TRINITY_DN44123_c0_g1_i1.p1  ORF type:complete len:378 (-),score=98.29 TRINITY_DN44123_c0_g1_i1:633-1766(-)
MCNQRPNLKWAFLVVLLAGLVLWTVVLTGRGVPSDVSHFAGPLLPAFAHLMAQEGAFGPAPTRREDWERFLKQYSLVAKNMTKRVETVTTAMKLIQNKRNVTKRKVMQQFEQLKARLENSKEELKWRRARAGAYERGETPLEDEPKKQEQLDIVYNEDLDEEDDDLQECLAPFIDGCEAIKDKQKCLSSKDGRSEVPQWKKKTKLRVLGEPCVWCGGEPCVKPLQGRPGGALCESMDWLLNGKGGNYKEFLASESFEIARCSGDEEPEGPNTTTIVEIIPVEDKTTAAPGVGDDETTTVHNDVEEATKPPYTEGVETATSAAASQVRDEGSNTAPPQFQVELPGWDNDDRSMEDIAAEDGKADDKVDDKADDQDADE